MMKASVAIAVAAGFLFSAPAFAADMEALAKAKNCMTCHKTDGKLIGPSYKETAAKYAARKDAVAYLADKIIKGGTGVWGQVPMPPNPQVSPEDAKKLAEWVMGHK